jgi:hypothetical protein
MSSLSDVVEQAVSVISLADAPVVTAAVFDEQAGPAACVVMEIAVEQSSLAGGVTTVNDLTIVQFVKAPTLFFATTYQ